jgi:hypothetical protein
MARNLHLQVIPLIFIFISLISSCTDKCESTNVYYTWEPVTFKMDDLIDSIKSESPRSLENPGKIYYKNNFIYVNEVKKGVHIIDNSNPSSPQNIGFIYIPGNFDIAIRNNTLYADSYSDLIVLDITNHNDVVIKARVKGIFPHSGSTIGGFNYDKQTEIVTTYQSKRMKVVGDCNQNVGVWFNRGVMELASFDSKSSLSVAPNTTGKAGSMARFALYQNYLYTVSTSEMMVFDVSSPSSPTEASKLNLGWGVETIWPYKDKLFLGTNTGMQIFDNKNPALPEHLSTFSHVRSCDPVIADDKYAYLTLRTGTTCQRGVNELQVIDLENLRDPKIVKSYPMDNPHGLGKDNDVLFICDGKSGLKVFDAADVEKIDENQLAHYDNINTFDVIPLDGTLLMTGPDGLYQYDYSDLKNIRQISKIPVVSKD